MIEKELKKTDQEDTRKIKGKGRRHQWNDLQVNIQFNIILAKQA